MTGVIVVGGGPAGLMAADVVSAAGVRVTVYDRMPSVGRKLLIAGRGGLNLTHSEPIEPFLARYGEARAFLQPTIEGFTPEALTNFANLLGQETFVGSSGRVFPRAMKASPLLRAWLNRLKERGVDFRVRHRMVGLGADLRATFERPDRDRSTVGARAIVLALGGASWPRLGSDGEWPAMLSGLGLDVRPLRAANVGTIHAWSEHFAERFAGEPLKRIAVAAGGRRVRGEAVVTRAGLEGGAIYALAPELRRALDGGAEAVIEVDLRPDLPIDAVRGMLGRPRGKQSTSTWLRKALQLSPAAIGLLREVAPDAIGKDPAEIANLIKCVRIDVKGLGGLDKAISSAGGVSLDGIGPDMMVKAVPGLFVAGEMLDWEAPTGGYLLQGCFSTGHAAGSGVLRYLANSGPDAGQDRDAAAAARDVG